MQILVDESNEGTLTSSQTRNKFESATYDLAISKLKQSTEAKL